MLRPATGALPQISHTLDILDQLHLLRILIRLNTCLLYTSTDLLNAMGLSSLDVDTEVNPGLTVSGEDVYKRQTF